ncbi:sgt1 and cs domain containing protein [Grosmannia clavigera kw1407]|uniref:Sgt1 and cs domain containing protein n=1 Tax=Grosmannia clavigera (strain kw1407 / UAMH 11150) TaxID=655863 RepID=F0XL13_GROCL|nr:sgt1 and cs domain containing protein [Grosmannia clavigera kw1407]EFX01601.1 sgt1 and cs domain containing protein [Grosmannia clavigera kw1407]
MSYITDGQNGLEAVEGKKWKEGIELLSKALEHSENPAWLLARSHAYQETKELALALEDADHAYVSATERQHAKSREQMALAQYRRAVILGHLKRYADADACCVWSQQLMEGKNFRREEDDVAKHVDEEGDYLATAEEALSTSTMPVDKQSERGAVPDRRTGAVEWSRAYVWRSMMLNAMAKLPKGDAGRKITVARVPMKPAKKAAAVDMHEVKSDMTPTKTAETKKEWATKKLRVDFYQKPETVNLVLYAKGADKDKVQVDVRELEIVLSNLPEAAIGSTWAVLDLSGEVDPADKTIRVTPFKIELTLKKKLVGTKWATWGTQREEGSGVRPTFSECSTASSTQATRSAGPLLYPSSSRTGPKNWATVDLGDEDEEQNDVNAFFKKLYAGSTPEQQRAMAKSFTESNGTSLSTDWSSVSSGPVATQPPDGVEAKKW